MEDSLYQHGSNEDEQGTESSEHAPLWMIIYTDMVTNLMIFFLLCYCLTWLSEQERQIAAASFTQTFSNKQNEVTQTIQKIDETQQQTEQEQKNVEQEVAQKFSNVEINEEKIKITLPSPVLFDSGKADLKPATYTTLKDIADMIRNVPNRVVVEGHTDNKPFTGKQFKSNWELSAARAFSVIQYFIEKETIDPKRLSAFGYGEFRPKTPNDTETNRSINRRIEINIIKIK
jgi:chemotaxis protein MotB